MLTAKEKPNIILIFSDDVGFEEFGCYGVKEGPTLTPHIDGLAEKGIMFRNCWTQSICGPSRSMLYTGHYAVNSGAYDNKLDYYPGTREELLAKRKELPQLTRVMHKAGYRIAFAGKWHNQVYGGSVCHNQKDLGIDTYMETSTNPKNIESITGRKMIPDENWEIAVLSQQPIVSRYWKPGIVCNGEVLETTMQDYGPDMLSDFICDFITEQSGSDQPFLAIYAMNLAHSSHCVTPIDVSRGEAPSNKHYPNNHGKGMEIFHNQIRYIDKLVGKIVQQVKEAGNSDNTLIIFSSDNGTTASAKSKGVEYGVHVPFVLAGGGIKQRGETDELMDFTDILPTFADLACAPLQDGQVDGISLKSFLMGETDTTKPVIYSFPGITRLIRTKDYLLEAVCPLYDRSEGRFYKTSGSFDGRGYENITHSPGYAEVREQFSKYMEVYPALLPVSFNNPVWERSDLKRGYEHYMDPKRRRSHLALPARYKFYDESF